MKYAIGVDIGGTKVAIAVVNEKGQIKEQTIIPTDLTITPEAMIDRIADVVRETITQVQIDETDIIGMGIGAPGPLDSKNGMVTCPPNLTGWVDVPICEQLAQSFSYPIRLENDANVAALAEKWIGAATECDNFTYMTVSTGIGGGVIIEGKLLRGVKGNAGDIGHTVVDPDFGPCVCGQYGCLEIIASGTAIAKRGSEIMGETLTTKEVFDLYHEGQRDMVQLVKDVFQVLGMACVNIVNTFDPEKIVIGGGVSKVGAPMFEAINDYVSQYALNPAGRQTEVVPAKLDQSSGVVGAAALCFGIVS